MALFPLPDEGLMVIVMAMAVVVVGVELGVELVGDRRLLVLALLAVPPPPPPLVLEVHRNAWGDPL